MNIIQSNLRKSLLTVPLSFAATLTITNNSISEVVELQMDAPNFDRWMYPYNATPGARSAGPTFAGSEGADDRYGQNMYGFITQDVITPDLGKFSYEIQSAELQIQISNENVIYDPSYDSWETYKNPKKFPDQDLGRPFELFGANFRNDWNGWSFGESGPGPFAFGVEERNVYPIAFNASGLPIDASNNLRDEYNPIPFAIGENDQVQPGGFLPELAVMTFDLDVTDTNIQCYLRESLNDGLLSLVLTSLHFGTQDGGGSYPQIILKESPLVAIGAASAATLNLTVVITDGATMAEDLNGDNEVDVTDLLILIADWGDCNCCPSDINSDGEVDVIDLLAVIAAWS